MEYVKNPEFQKDETVDLKNLQSRLNEKPELQQLLLQMLEQTLDKGKEEKRSGKKKRAVSSPPKKKSKTSKSNGGSKGNKINVFNKQVIENEMNKSPLCPVKSPSDTTVYRPALRQKQIEKLKSSGLPKSIEQIDLNDKIANFVEAVRAEKFPRESAAVADSARPSTSRPQPHESGYQADRGADPDDLMDQQEQARQITNDIIIETERQKAKIAAPNGRSSLINPVMGVPIVDLNFNDDNVQNFM